MMPVDEDRIAALWNASKKNISAFLLLKADLRKKVRRPRQIAMRVGDCAGDRTFDFRTESTRRDINHINRHSD